MATIIVQRPEQQIDEVLNDTAEHADAGTTDFPGKTYEEGVSAGIEWLLGRTDENPVTD